jgi:hypothetical protein
MCVFRPEVTVRYQIDDTAKSELESQYSLKSEVCGPERMLMVYYILLDYHYIECCTRY